MQMRRRFFTFAPRPKSEKLASRYRETPQWASAALVSEHPATLYLMVVLVRWLAPFGNGASLLAPAVWKNQQDLPELDSETRAATTDFYEVEL